MKLKALILLAFSSLVMASCGGGSPSNPTTSSDPTSVEPEIVITDEDKAYPNDSTLEYDDYVGRMNDFDYDTSKWYRNDLTIRLPDPTVYEEDGVYYVTGTTDRTGARNFDMYSTTDFTNYEAHHSIWEPSKDGFANISCFAPEIFKIGDTYYLYFSAGNSEQTNVPTGIFVATADNILGPYTEYQGENALGEYIDLKKGPLFHDPVKPHLSILDVTILDDDGELYLYYSVYESGIMQYIVGVEMLDPVTPNWDTHTVVVVPGALDANNRYSIDLPWEAIKNFRVAEGPQVTKMPNGKYMISYSVNHYPDIFYSVCYGISDSPLGPFEKPYEKGGTWTNLLFGYAGTGVGTVAEQWNGFVGGTAHHFIFKSGDQYMIGYHSLTARKEVESHPGRAFAVDYLFFDEVTGMPYVHGPTWSVQPLPEAMSGYKNIALDATFTTENIENPERLNDNFIVEHYHLPQEKDKEATLTPNKSYVKITFDKEYAVGGLSIYNSAEYEYYLPEVSFVKFGGEGNNILGSEFSLGYLKHATEFIFPCSAFTYNLHKDVVTDEIIIEFASDYNVKLNEIMVLGKEVN